MADTTLLLNGFSVIGNPQTNTNARNGGELMIHDGSAVFEADDILVFQVSGANPDGSLNDNSVITGLIVYDNATDYFNDTALYTYTTTPGNEVDLATGRNSMGDRYLQFDASNLTSSDTNAPVLDDLTAVAGVDILASLGSNSGPFKIPTNEDIDLNGDGIITPDEQADGTFSSDINILAVICFAKGTLIQTPDGLRKIEELEVGDMVETLDRGAMPIRWISGVTVPGIAQNAPVRIAPGTLGNTRELVVSQSHRMLLRGPMAELLTGEPEVLVAAKHLVNDKSIRIIQCPEVTYYHFLLDTHEIVFAESCPAESLYPGQQTLNAVTPDEQDEIIALFPDMPTRSELTPMSRMSLKGYEARALSLSA